MSRIIRSLAIAGMLILALAGPAGADGHVVNLEASLSGAAEVGEAGDPDGFGSASFAITPETGEVCFDVSVGNIADPAAAHIHIGGVGSNGGVVVNLDWANTGGSGCVSAPSPALVAITTNPSLYYVNVHNGDHPAGAIRGQLSAASGPSELAFTGSGLTTVLAIAGASMLAAGTLLVRAERRHG